MSIARAIQNAASGVRIAEVTMDVVANGFANLQNHGGKVSWVEVGAMGAQTMMSPGAATEEGANGVGIQLGLGATVKAIHKDMTQGSIQESDSPFHMAIQWQGFFQFIKPDGRVVFSRKGICRLDRNRNIVNSDGYILAPGIQVPDGYENVEISKTGEVSVQMPGQREMQNLGTVEIARFIEPRVLTQEGDYFTPNSESGDPEVGTPDTSGRGLLISHHLETSNGSAIKLMGDMIQAQRNHGQCLAIIKKADEMSESQTRIVS
jgi:flagellar basal-body rod protein FlgG